MGRKEKDTSGRGYYPTGEYGGVLPFRLPADDPELRPIKDNNPDVKEKPVIETTAVSVVESGS